MGFFNSVSKIINLLSRESIEKQRYVNRIKQILLNSIELINKSNNPKTVFSRYEVIRLKTKELLLNVPEAIKDLSLNGHTITAENIDSVVDLAKSDWFVSYIKAESNEVFAANDKKVQSKRAKKLLKWMPDIAGTPISSELREIKDKLQALFVPTEK